MKDEEMAEEWWNSWVVKDWNDLQEGKRLFIQAFLAGLKAGRPQWHKADVPTTPINKVVLGYIKDYYSKKFCFVKWNGEWWYDARRTWNDKVKLIAWKEIVLPELPKEIE